MKSELALALIMKRWRDWQNVVNYQLPSQQQVERLNLIRLYKLYKKIKEKESKDVQVQVNSISNKRRASCILGKVPVKKLNLEDKYPLVVRKQVVPHDKYYNYIRLDVESYYDLLKLVEKKIKKKMWAKTPVKPHMRLQICLRYLASGDSMLMIAYEYEIAPNTVSKIVKDTCQVIYNVLSDDVLPPPSTDMWKEKEQEFESQYSFPHCIGAIGGKQILFQTPFFKDVKGKEKGSLAVFGIVDTNCCFSTLTIGLEAIEDNCIFFSQSQIGRDLEENVYDFPPLSEDSGKYSELPYVLISNKDFPLTKNMLQSYQAKDTLDLSQKAFNYKIDSVNKCVTNAFDILTSQWKLFQKKFSTNARNSTKIVKAIVCLHNLIMQKEITKPLEEREYAVVIERDHSDYVQGCIDIFMHPEEPTDEAVKIRNIFKEKLCQVETITLINWK